MLGTRSLYSVLQKSVLVALAGGVMAASATPALAQRCDGDIDLAAIPDDDGDDTAALEEALQRATDYGKTIVIPAGTYRLNRAEGITIHLKNSFSVDATGAVFVVGSALEGDVIGIDSHPASFRRSICGNTSKADVTWTGGDFDLREMMVSTSVPINGLTTDRPTSSQATADALSLRGASTRNGNRTQKLGDVIVRNLTVTGSDGSWRTAGGDSGLFIGGASSVLVEDSQFYGIRDAGIYLSADDRKDAFGRDYTVRRVSVERSYDGITTKRGADNIVYENNMITDSVVALSIKAIRENLYAVNVTMTGNELRRCVRCILVENANDVDVTGNSIYAVGDPVAGDNTPVNARGRQYEAIALEGTRGTNQVRDNLLEATMDEDRAERVTTWAHVSRDYKGRPSTQTQIDGNTLTGSWDKIEAP